MFKRFFNSLKNYNRICVNYRAISYKYNEHCLEKKKHINFNNWNVQQFDFYSLVTNSVPLPIHTLEQNIITLCIHLRNGRVVFDDLNETIKIYEEQDYPLLKDVSLVLLKCCGELLPNVDVKARQKLTKRVWDLIQSKDCPLTLEHYKVLLALYAENSELINPQEFLDNMKIKPDESIYCSLLNVISKMDDHELVSNIISKFGENLSSWSKNAFNTAIEAYAMQGNIMEAHKLISTMESIGIMPSSESYLGLTFGFAKMGNITNIEQIFQKYQPNIEHLMKIVKILSYHGYGQHIPSTLTFLRMPLNVDKLFIINNTIIELIYSNQKAEALSIIKSLHVDVEIIDACIEYVKYVVSEEIRLNKPDQDVVQVVSEFKDNEKYSQIINEATKIALSHGKITLAVMLFDNMRENNVPVRSHYYWPLFLQIYKYQEGKRLSSLISHMISLDVRIDADTLINYIFPFIDTTNPVTATKMLIDAGINYHIVITSLNAFLLKNNRMEDVITLCSKYKMKLDFHDAYLRDSLIEGYKKRTDMSTYVLLLLKIPYTNNPPFLYIVDTLLNYAKDSNKIEQFIDFLEKLKMHHVKIPVAEVKIIQNRIEDIEMNESKVEIILDLLNNMSSDATNLDIANESEESLTTSVLSFYPHPKKMDSRELQNHIIELEHKNMETRGAVKKLLNKLCAQNDLKAANEIKQYIISNGFKWSPGMCAFLFNLYLKNKLLDQAEIELMEILNNYPKFRIDGAKILLYAITLVEHNRLSDAFDAINNLKNVNLNVTCRDKCFQLLDTISKSVHYESTEKMLETLAANKYCKIDNVLVIPLVRRHLLNNDVESAIDAFIHCVNKYRLTPMKQVILTRLIGEANASRPNVTENLKKVMQCITSIYGKDVALMHLITSLAEIGEVEKLKKIFQMHKLDMQILSSHLKHYPADKSAILFNIFKSIANMKDVLKDPVCDLIISLCKETNDYEAARTLLRKMQAADIIPSKYFQSTFYSLEANNKRKMENQEDNK